MSDDLRTLKARFGILAAVQDRINTAVAETRTQMAAGMTAVYQQDGSTSGNIEIPGVGKVGKVTLPENKDAVKVTDEKAYTEWVAANAPSEIEWVQRVRTPFRDAHIKALLADGGADYVTGLVVDVKRTRDNDGVAVVVKGVEAVKGEGFKSPSVTGLKKDEIIAAIRSQSLLELLPAEADQAPADERVVDGELATDAPPVEDLAAMKRPELTAECDRLGLDHVGTLTQLRKRIVAARDEQNGAAA